MERGHFFHRQCHRRCGDVIDADITVEWAMNAFMLLHLFYVFANEANTNSLALTTHVQTKNKYINKRHNNYFENFYTWSWLKFLIASSNEKREKKIESHSRIYNRVCHYEFIRTCRWSCKENILIFLFQLNLPSKWSRKSSTSHRECLIELQKEIIDKHIDSDIYLSQASLSLYLLVIRMRTAWRKRTQTTTGVSNSEMEDFPYDYDV